MYGRAQKLLTIHPTESEFLRDVSSNGKKETEFFEVVFVADMGSFEATFGPCDLGTEKTMGLKQMLRLDSGQLTEKNNKLTIKDMRV